MNLRSLATLALVVHAAMACAPTPPATEQTDLAATGDSARTFLDDFARLGRAGQLDSLGRLYSADRAFRFYESGALRYLTADSVRAGLNALPAGTTIHTTFSETVVTPLSPGLAMIGTRFTTAFGDSLRPTFSFGGAMTLLLRHEAEGWRILSGHTSVAVPRRN